MVVVTRSMYKTQVGSFTKNVIEQPVIADTIAKHLMCTRDVVSLLLLSKDQRYQDSIQHVMSTTFKDEHKLIRELQQILCPSTFYETELERVLDFFNIVLNHREIVMNSNRMTPLRQLLRPKLDEFSRDRPDLKELFNTISSQLFDC